MVIVSVHCYAIYFPLCGLNVRQSVTFLFMLNDDKCELDSVNNKQYIITTIIL